ncbi:MAG: hypothetical protein M1819_001406 [Sarea resinae]|nr:MAG: hypothetical protein M1819_001406 [Sarea resinae]
MSAAASSSSSPLVAGKAPNNDNDDGSDKPTTREKLPKLSDAELRIYNKTAMNMNAFHNHFREQWNTLYSACTAARRPPGYSIRQFINYGLEFCGGLGLHHSIEEEHIFPILAKRMPAFRKELELLTQHKQIHVGLDKLELYLEQCRTGERELRLEEMKEIMDSFGKVLWEHLDDEVRELGAEEMRKYWTPAEMRRIPL